MANTSPLSNRDRVAALLLYYFRAGRDSVAVLGKEADTVHIPTPSEADLAAVAESAPMRLWRGIEPIAEQVVRSIRDTEPRDIADVARDVVTTARSVKKKLENYHGVNLLDPSKGARR